MIFYLAAILAALCWAFATMVSVYPAKAMGSFSFNRLRINLVFFVLLIYSLVVDVWPSFNHSDWLWLLLSGAIGIFLGDTLLFTTLNQVGPRRTQVLFSTNALMTFAISFVFFHDQLSAMTLMGSGLVITGVFMAILFGSSKKNTHHLEGVKGKLWIGVVIGLSAAACQTFGILTAKPILDRGFDPIAASIVRLGIAALSLFIIGFHPRFRYQGMITPYLIWRVLLSGMLGMGIGMTLVIYALSGGHPGVVSSLAGASPALILPLLWFKTKKIPAPGAWVGAFLVVFGGGLILFR